MTKYRDLYQVYQEASLMKMLRDVTIHKFRIIMCLHGENQEIHSQSSYSKYAEKRNDYVGTG